MFYKFIAKLNNFIDEQKIFNYLDFKDKAKLVSAS